MKNFLKICIQDLFRQTRGMSRAKNPLYPIKDAGTVSLTLKNFESAMAAQVGVTRNLMSVFKGHKHYPPLSHDSWAWLNHIEGASAECAVAKHRDIFWDGSFGTFTDKPDVGPYHVKWVFHRDGRLRIPKKKPPDPKDIFILVRGTMPHYELVGWIRAGEVMKPENVDNPYNRGEEYFATQDKLENMADLPDE